jgi:hypothetical protein
MLDCIFGEAAIRGEAVRPMALVHIAVVFPVIMAGCIHAFTAALALAAAGVDLHRNPLARAVLVNAGAAGHHRTHVLVARREILVERVTSANHRRRPMVNNLQVGRADRDGVDAHQNLGSVGDRNRLLD